MRDRDLVDKLATIVVHADRLGTDDVLADAYRTCQQYVGKGYPTSTRAQPSGRSVGHGASATERHALNDRRDPFRADLAEADAHLRMAARSLAWLDRFATRYEHTTIADVDPEADDQCASCARLRAFSPPYRTPRDLEGVPHKPLCRWCYDVACAEGCWPPLGPLADHHRGKPISAQAMSEALGR